MCEYFCIGFVDSMFRGKSLIDFTNIFSPQDFTKNCKVILSDFLKQHIKENQRDLSSIR